MTLQSLIGRRLLRSSLAAGGGRPLASTIIGRGHYDNLVKQIKAAGRAEQLQVAFFPDHQLGPSSSVSAPTRTPIPARKRRSSKQ